MQLDACGLQLAVQAVVASCLSCSLRHPRGNSPCALVRAWNWLVCLYASFDTSKTPHPGLSYGLRINLGLVLHPARQHRSDHCGLSSVQSSSAVFSLAAESACLQNTP